MPELYPEDQKKVDKYLNQPEHSVKRGDFKPWRLLLVIFVVLAVLSAISYIISMQHGIV